MNDDLPPDLIHALSSATRIAVLTGAGVSAESGVPTFRDAQTGLWAGVDPMTLASPEGFSRDPGRVWDWYRWRRELIDGVEPNAGHFALATLESAGGNFTLITQNVDGLHRRAGSQNVLELHGNIMQTICSITRRAIDEEWLRQHSGQSPPPSPHHPEGLARPNVVWFGEMLPEKALESAFKAAETCDLMIVAGTAGAVQPAASLPAVARSAGAAVVDINPEPGPISQMADWHLAGTSGEWLPRLAAERVGPAAGSPARDL